MAEIVACRASDPIAEPVLGHLSEDYEQRYPGSTEIARMALTEFDPPRGAFVVILVDGVTVAGGGYRYLAPGVCEAKRLWTHPNHRRRGFGTMVLDELERLARDAGYSRLVLETGPHQEEARSLYSKRYRVVPTFGPYPEDTAFEVALAPPSSTDESTQ